MDERTRAGTGAPDKDGVPDDNFSISRRSRAFSFLIVTCRCRLVTWREKQIGLGKSVRDS
eukprot:2631915-Rhodomonas_salina.3